MLPEVVGAGLVAYAFGAGGDARRGGGETVAQFGGAGGDYGEDGRACPGEVPGARVGHVAQFGRRRLLEEAGQAPCRIHERRVVGRRKQHDLAAERLAQVRTHMVILCIVQFFNCYSALRAYATTTLLGLSTESPLTIIF